MNTLEVHRLSEGFREARTENGFAANSVKEALIGRLGKAA
jgi:hypothetical protein